LDKFTSLSMMIAERTQEELCLHRDRRMNRRGAFAFHPLFTGEVDAPREPRHRVLIADDDEDVLLALHDVIRLRGMEPRIVRNGNEALEQLGTGERLPCLILLDLWMPCMDGLTLVDRLRGDEDLGGVPIVLMSGCATTRSLCDHQILGKPLQLDHIAPFLRRVELQCAICDDEGDDSVIDGRARRVG
jgi:CheY-like chemotaxis protein